MNILLWILASVLAVVFLASGVMKLLRSKPQLADSGQGWVDPVPPGAIKLIGALEVAGAVGLILPAAIGVAATLTPVAATGLTFLMIGAAVTHGRRGEVPNLLVNIVLAVLTAIVVWGRFGPHAF
ncbi:DoxX family protein [Micromonospora sp. NPDC050397]|uniref:DoxX family protein n=1 Tax=Micromonospora sp. NPDC050397 TaxID=3364279 RepID=UPI0038500E34